MWSRSELKTRAKEVLHLNYWKAVLVALICSFVSGGGGGGGSSSSKPESSSSGSSLGTPSSMTQEELAGFFVIIGIAIVIFLVILAFAFALSAFIFQPLYVGCCRFFINCGKGTASLNDVTFAFSNSCSCNRYMHFSGHFCLLSRALLRAMNTA